MDNVTLIRIVSGFLALVVLFGIPYLIWRASKKTAVKTGIGGWLALFTVKLGLTSLVYTVAGLAAIAKGDSANVIGGVMLTALGIFGFIVLRKLMKFNPQTVTLVYVFLSANIVFWLLALYGDRGSTSTAVPDGAVRTIIASMVWAAYFSQSKRVKNTFVKPSASSASEYSSFDMDAFNAAHKQSKEEYKPFADVR